ncbi:replication protein A 70 kDa DNA-binding subunit-like [Galendromus occidentalis]|uniref:Replication protein A 70 kDa DNA-binding subunit-like n=1 Tax=Galendromus occidentalis TaxID=34638 RepID=A0AAJ6QQU3_9ACAR|nr:replication protein A 70 kDa DNA-binding subunit-like [Galendromus occidentalis]XP_003737458.1 replication protein A 70 kDa DNA-binding subunit-like [Galendromus occidentalis]XP_003737923.1 replication protein A 70 kDa DNA-binding subunit-like [Galendromus occidentalis]XP_003740876.1 replication protein A 70 kDa DNA-binding subunit-like [Galendromus occidentalis]XP_003740987.1 replication protein A 70 kDa DNA-binding subunit-like [Galendromus occidentalis]XP_003745124.1 replication protein 
MEKAEAIQRHSTIISITSVPVVVTHEQSGGAKTVQHITEGKGCGQVEGRVKSKTPVKHWSKGDGSGKIFNFVMSDTSGEINVIASGDSAEEIFDMITVGQCYKINAYKVKAVNPQYRATDHECELQLTKLSKVIPITGNDLPKIQAQTTVLMELLTKPVNTTVDILVVVFDVRPPQTFNCRDGINRVKQTVTVLDDSMKMVNLGLWSEFVGKLDGKEGEAVILQNLQVRDYNGTRQLSTTTNTIIREAAGDADAERLRQWFKVDGCSLEFEELFVLTETS